VAIAEELEFLQLTMRLTCENATVAATIRVERAVSEAPANAMGSAESETLS
jgi:hypothetical protein